MVVADGTLVREEVSGDDGTDGVAAEVLRSGVAGAVAVGAGQWLEAARLELGARTLSAMREVS